MPYRFDFDPVNQIFRCQLSGNVTDHTMMQCYMDAAAYARHVSLRMAILEFVDITNFEVSTTLVSLLAAAPSAIPDPEKPRIIVAPSDMIYGKCRNFEILGGDTRPNLSIVRTPDEAYAQFGVQNPRFEPVRNGAGDFVHG